MLSWLRDLFGKKDVELPGDDPVRSRVPLAEGRVLDVPSGYNVRELGGYPTPYGQTLYHRFVRSGDTDGLSSTDIAALRDYGVSMDVDLRSQWEVTHAPDRLAKDRGVRSLHAQLHSYDMHAHDLKLPDDTEGYMANGYLSMLENRKVVRKIFSFMAKATDDECVLFHCAAGMDRTGVTSMLVLGLCEASREDILRDYLYSFADADRVEELLDGKDSARSDFDGPMGADMLMHTMSAVYQALLDGCGSVRGYLLSCGLSEDELDRVRRHLVG